MAKWEVRYHTYDTNDHVIVCASEDEAISQFEELIEGDKEENVESANIYHNGEKMYAGFHREEVSCTK